MKENIYFRNLTGFRFIAALMVFICHLELFKSRNGIINYWKFPLVFEGASAGVDFFFVLSGFLITYLLIREKEATSTLYLRNFYLRRILRIWPLYFLILFFSFCVLPNIQLFNIKGYTALIWNNFTPKFLLTILLMPNLALALFFNIPYAAPLWSVGVEEQFYLIWPLLFLKNNKFIKPICIFILIFISLKIIMYLVGTSNIMDALTYEKLKNFIVTTRMECMGIGGLGAIFYHKKNKLWNLLSRNDLAILSIILLPILLLNVSKMFELHHIIFSVLFLIIILNGATNQNTFINLESRPFHFLGSISYGIYLWHSLIIGGIVGVMNSLSLWQLPYFNVVYYVLSFVLTIVISYLSYTYFERRFLRLKKKYSPVQAGSPVIVRAY